MWQRTSEDLLLPYAPGNQVNSDFMEQNMIKERRIPEEIMSQMKSEAAAAFYLDLMASEDQEQASNQLFGLFAS